MTVYVDNAATAASRIFDASRLSADTLAELHAFARRLGLDEDQPTFKIHRTATSQCAGGDACVHWHYQLTEPQRGQAKRFGAKLLDWETLCSVLSAPRFAEALAANRAAGLDRPPGYGLCPERDGLEQGYKVEHSWMAMCVRCGMITARRDTDGMAWCGGKAFVLVQSATPRPTAVPDPVERPRAEPAQVASSATAKRTVRYSPASQRHSWTKGEEHHKTCDFCRVHVENHTKNHRDWWQTWTWPDGKTGTNEGDAKPKLPRCPGPTEETN